MIDHVNATVSDVATAKTFYQRALEPLGYRLVMEGEGYAGFGSPEGIPDFWLSARPENGSTHIAFRAQDRDAVDRFHEAAVAAGGTDNGAPGLRPQYHEHYYGAYVYDADRNNIEAVCHTPE